MHGLNLSQYYFCILKCQVQESFLKLLCFWQVTDLRLALQRAEQQQARKEDYLREEISDLQQVEKHAHQYQDQYPFFFFFFQVHRVNTNGILTPANFCRGSRRPRPGTRSSARVSPQPRGHSFDRLRTCRRL